MYKQIAVSAALVAGLAAGASAQATANATVKAELTSTIALTVTGATDFGLVPNDGTVEIIDPTKPTAGQSTAEFIATTSVNTPITMSYNATPLVNTTDPNATITFIPKLAENGVDDPSTAAPEITDGTSTSGTSNFEGFLESPLYFWLGGTLQGTANKKPGTYTGTFTLTLAYQ